MVRSNAAEALGEIGDERAIKPLCKKLTENTKTEYSNSDWVRSASATALGKIGGSLALNCMLKVFLRLPSSSEMVDQSPYHYYQDESKEGKERKRQERESGS